MKIKKIAFVYDAIYPYVKGGGERRYYELAKRLSVKGHEVHLYGMKFWKGSNVIKKDGIYLHGICPAMPLYTKDGKRSIWQAIYFGINCLKLMKEDFDIIDCCGFPYFSLFACKLVCLLKHKKLNSTWHEVWGKEYWKAYLGNLWLFGYLVEGLAVKMPDKIIAGAPSATLKIKNDLKYHGSIVTIYSGVNLEEIEVVKPARFKSDIIYA
jgi:glycosyltransferase involved in cell wall biosynthesis